jgi:uncharacterized protein (DUF927 family)
MNAVAEDIKLLSEAAARADDELDEPAVKSQRFGGGEFIVRDDGVFFVGLKDSEPQAELFLCSRLDITAATRNGSSAAWGRLLAWRDRDDVPHRWAMPMDLLQGDGSQIRAELASLGLTIGSSMKARERLSAYLQGWITERRARCVDRLGWHGDRFLTTDGVVGDGDEIVVFQNPAAVEPAISAAGGAKQWRESVARLAAGNSRLMFAISTAFAGTLLDVVNADPGGFHLNGASSSGKSTALRAAASVWGPPAAYVRTWRATANGLEGVASLHNDGLLILDELSQIDPKQAGEAAYMLANGQGKVRADRTGAARAAARWRLLFLSAGEESLSALMAKDGRKANVGQELRLADIEADAGAGLGSFECLHEHPGGAAFSLAVIDASAQFYGAVGHQWLTEVVGVRGNLAEVIQDGIRQFIADYVPSHASGQVERVARRFGLVAVAGELATEFGLTGWGSGDAAASVGKCFTSWLAGMGTAGNLEVERLLAQIRGLLEAHGSSRFEDIHGERDRRIVNRMGYFRSNDAGAREYIVTPESFKRELCAGFTPKFAVSVLQERGWLVPDSDGKPQRRERLPDTTRVRCYVIPSSILGAGE